MAKEAVFYTWHKGTAPDSMAPITGGSDGVLPINESAAGVFYFKCVASLTGYSPITSRTTKVTIRDVADKFVFSKEFSIEFRND